MCYTFTKPWPQNVHGDHQWLHCSKSLYTSEVKCRPERMHAARAFTFYDGSAQQKHRGKRQGSENEAELVNEREGGEERGRGERKRRARHGGCWTPGPTRTWRVRQRFSLSITTARRRCKNNELGKQQVAAAGEPYFIFVIFLVGDVKCAWPCTGRALACRNLIGRLLLWKILPRTGRGIKEADVRTKKKLSLAMLLLFVGYNFPLVLVGWLCSPL